MNHSFGKLDHSVTLKFFLMIRNYEMAQIKNKRKKVLLENFVIVLASANFL